MRQPNERSSDRAARLSPRFWALVLAVGVVAGLAGAGLLGILHGLERVAWGPGGLLEAARATSPIHRVVVLSLAGALAGGGAYFLRHAIRGHGGGLTDGIWFHGGEFPLARTAARAVLAISVVALGASLGREGALKQAGAALASAAAGRFRLTGPERRLLAACGAAAGFAAAYDVPLGAALFAAEVLLGVLSLEVVAPLLLASVCGAGASRLFLLDRTTYALPHLATGWSQLAWAALAAPLLGVAAALYVRGFDRFDALEPRRAWLVAAPVLALTLLGLASIPFPELLGNGKDVVQEALRAALPLGLLAVLPALKFLAIGACAGSGVPGGLFTPTLCVGSLLGGLLGAGWERLWPGGPVGAYPLVAMGAFLAGATHGPISAVALVLELTGNLHALAPLALACAIAVPVSRALEPRSLYTARLERHLRQALALAPPPRRDAEGVSLGRGESLPAAARFAVVVDRLLSRPGRKDPILVIDHDARPVGRLTLASVRRRMATDLPRDFLTASDLADPIGERVAEGASPAERRTALSRAGRAELPVVDRDGRVVEVLREGAGPGD